MKRFCLIGFLTLLFTLPSLAQGKAKDDTLVFTPSWTAQSQFAGYYVALEKGFYAEEGVKVAIVHPNATQSAEERIRHNKSQATTLQLSHAMQIIDDGIPLVNLLQTSMNNALIMVYRPGVDTLEQTRIKVALWRVGYNQLATSIAKEMQMDFEWIHAANSVNLFIAGAVDASLAMSYNEYLQLLQAGIPLTEECLFRFKDHGYNIQEDGLYVTRAYYRKHRDRAEKFAKASRRGWEYAVAHPEETLDIVMKYVDMNHIATNRVIQDMMLQEILRLQLDPDSGERAFRLREDMVQQASDLMLRSGLIKKPVTIEKLSR